MHGWFTDPRFVDDNGKPRALPVTGTASFQDLVKQFSGDIPKRAVLDELLAAGMVQRDSSGCLRAVRRHNAALGGPNTDLQTLVVDTDVFFSSAIGDPDGQHSSLRRVSVRFAGKVPPSVRRNVALRTERFLDALSEYLHTESAYRQEMHGGITLDGESFHVLIAQSDSGDHR
jgi:hypothetical protein